MKKYLKYFSVAGALSLLVICYFQQKQNAKLRAELNVPVLNVDSLIYVNDSLQHRLDSLDMEMLPTQIELGRYQVAFTIFAERNPKAAEQYAEIISSETE